MLTALHDQVPELQAVIATLKARQSVLQLKARLLRGMRTELQAARDSGLTWRMIWEAMREVGYPGAYPNFCRAAKSLMQTDAACQRSKSENLPLQSGGKVDVPRTVTRDRSKDQEEKPEWQRRREEAMAKLDREAEQNRERERLTRPKVFNPPPFMGRGE